MAIWTRAEYFGWRDLLLVKLMLILANSTVGCFAGSDAVTIGTKWIMTNLWQTYDSRLVLSPKWVEINQLSNDREFTIISSYTHLKFRRLFLVEVVGRGNKKPLKNLAILRSTSKWCYPCIVVPECRLKQEQIILGVVSLESTPGEEKTWKKHGICLERQVSYFLRQLYP